jgi:ferric-dicitrate binding protein FerR (iron transport regulator)
VGQPARNPEPEAPISDPETLERAYRLERAKRRARLEHEREQRRARLRFWVVLLLLVALMVTFAVLAWHQVQHIFGI